MGLLSIVPTGHSAQPLRDFWRLRSHDIPDVPGVYVLLARPDTQFLYPKGKSAVFYIGQASDLSRRLRSHLHFAIQAREDRQLKLYWRRYEYAAAVGCRYTYVRANRRNPRLLEDTMLTLFANRFRSVPVANGGGGWGQ